MNHENLILKDWRIIDFSFGLVYPNVYKVGMSSYSIRLLYYLINSNDKIVCERFFLPEKVRYPASLDQNQLVRSIENHVPLSEFDIIGFSLQYENDFKNVLWFLENAKIPLDSKERNQLRKQGYEFPLIIAGGPVSTSNPLPFAPFFDLFFIGDSEPNLKTFFQVFKNFKELKSNFKDLLNNCKYIQGIYIPLVNNDVIRTVQKNLDNAPIPKYQLISTRKGIFESNFFLEVNRGCPFQCKFCISSFHNHPFRNRSYEKLIEAIESAYSFLKFDKISLIGSCVSAHPKFQELCEYILKKKLNFTIPSIRFEHISSEIIDLLEKNNTKTITVAPETGSERLRNRIGKFISNKTIFSKVEMIKNSSIRNIKFYFLLGLPGEDEIEINNLLDMLIQFSEMGFEKSALRVSINPLIPKFNTPYYSKVNHLLERNLNSLKQKFLKIEEELKNYKSIRIKTPKINELIKQSRLQALISLGNRRVANLLKEYYLEGATFGALRRVEKQNKLNIDDYFKKIQNGYIPWSYSYKI
ncbi:MAG: B12-binding domain-containing radical SAM protein [Promethearchaeota archaeon]